MEKDNECGCNKQLKLFKDDTECKNCASEQQPTLQPRFDTMQKSDDNDFNKLEKR